MTTTPATNGTKKNVARTANSLPSPQQIIAKCQALWHQPKKTKKGFGYKYADLAQVIEIVTDFLIKEFGASFRQPIAFRWENGKLMLRVKNILWAPPDQEMVENMDFPIVNYRKDKETVVNADGVVMKTPEGLLLEREVMRTTDGPDMQDSGSSITYARRYSMLAFFGFTQEDDDGERPSKRRTAASRDTSPPEDIKSSNGNGVKPRPWLTMKLDGKNTRYRFQSAPDGKASIVLMGSFGQGQELPRVPTKQGIGNITLTHMLGRPVKGGEQWLFDFKAVGK